MGNKIFDLLCFLDICTPDSVELFHKGARDNPNINVMKCKKSGIIFLSDIVDISHYEDSDLYGYFGENINQIRETCLEDNQRRFEQFKHLIIGSNWLDIGTGIGGILELGKNAANKIVVVEPQKIRKELIGEGYNVFKNIYDVTDKNFDVVTLFHVFEHFDKPLEMLKLIFSKMEKGGKIIIEVPHANDFLISFLKVNEFIDTVFFSEHLILHTRKSLKIFLQEAGFININIWGIQRYPFSNHLYWLKEKKRDGHKKWPFLNNPTIDNGYEQLLNGLDMTDTLMAVAEKPGSN